MSRRFTEEEAQRIFARVAERQREVAVSLNEGLSLAELEEAARAAGLDPALVVAAAGELDAAPHAEKTLAGAPVEVVRQRVVATPLGDDTWAQMVGADRSEFGRPGMAGQIGRLREWTCISGGARNGTITRLTAEPTAGGTRVTVSRSVRDAVLGFTLASVSQGVMALVFGLLALVGVDAGLWILAAILLGLSLLFGLGTQAGTRLWHRREATRFDRLLDRLELTVRDTLPERLPAASVPERPGRLDLDSLPRPGAALADAPEAETRRRERA